jgi:hypothetical protein
MKYTITNRRGLWTLYELHCGVLVAVCHSFNAATFNRLILGLLVDGPMATDRAMD